MLEEYHAKFGGFYQLAMGLETVYVCADPVIANKILQSSDPQHLHKPNFIYDVIFVDAFRNGLVASEGVVWSIHRKVLSRCFTYRSFQIYLTYMNEHSKVIVDKFLHKCSNSQESVSGPDIYEVIWSETMKLIIRVIMGDNVCSDEYSRKMRAYFKRGKVALQHRFLHPELLIQPIWKFHPVKKELDHVVETLSEMANQVINDHKMKREMVGSIGALYTTEHEIADVDEDIGLKTSKSIIEEMLNAGASDKEIYDEFSTFVITGHETSSITLNQVLFYLAANQDCQEKCRQEIDQVFSNMTDQNLLMDDLNKMKYTERCILETLRVTTTVPIFFRHIKAPLKIDDDLTLGANTTILFNTWSLHRDPKIYPEPLKFNPDRFLPENVKQRHPYSFMPFSGGVRNCIGYKFSLLEIKTILSNIIRNFEIYTTDKTEEINYFLELTLIPDKQPNIILKKRNLV